MKFPIVSLLVASSLALLAGAAHADVTHLTSRDSVRSELIRLERAGYQPARNSNQYPDDIQAAEARLNGDPAVRRDTSGYGPMPAASAQGGGVATSIAGPRGGIYARH
ncbi:DUF4148 domain-containing protein [Burkholderia gladioli]|uniref:DUF4148 domain-containing protein n=1 Tax=Burkholderia gladioli (strain BSR3) TaxID=999541 RepID=F2LKW0_BURGS|nr:DUF4148 domain-containing protein [Burkholderia gladioli]AEA63006.1 hypothetical protein bgla_2g05300 [Burkholderia gladioli BSR3]MBW5284970.1 DUF4148 domain-containing protein [Burkholderia gladioli]